MKNLIAVSLLAVCGAYAQTVLVPTTLSAAVADSKTRTIVVASATNFAVGSVAYVDRELMDINAVNSTTITVRRGAGGTTSAPHASGALVFVGTPTQFFSLQFEPQGSCTRATEVTLPKINTRTGVVSDCLGGGWVNGVGGIGNLSSRYRISSPDPGATAYTSINTNGTTLGATTLYCTEVFLHANKLLTGAAVLAGTTVTTDKWYYVLYDSAGKVLANSAVAGATLTGASTYQQQAFTSKYFAVGPADYFVCFQTNGTTATARMTLTGTQDNLLTAGQTGATFGTIPALTVPTSFTTAVGPYVYLY